MNEFEMNLDVSGELAVFDEIKYSQESFIKLIDEREYKTFRATVSEIPSADIAEIMSEIPKEKYAIFFRLLP